MTRRMRLPRPRQVAPIPSGEVNVCFDLLLAGGEHLILKVQHRGNRPEILLREREVCRLLLDDGLPVPNIIDVNTEREIIPYNYSLLTALSGTDGAVAFDGLSPARQRSTFRQLGQTLARIHKVPLEKLCRSPLLSIPATISDWICQQRQRFADTSLALGRAGFLPAWLLDGIRQFWSRHEPFLFTAERLCLLHGDYGLHNVKLLPPKPDIAGVFDLEQNLVGQPECDFAALEAGVLSIRADLRDSFYRGYLDGRPLEPGTRERVRLYTLLRHLELMLAYQGPLRFMDGTGSAAETIARLVLPPGEGDLTEISGRGGVLEPPIRSTPGCHPADPASLDAISGQYLADILARGFVAEINLRYWHRFDSPHLQGWAGRSGARLIFFQNAVQVAGRPTQDVNLVMKITGSRREANFFRTLARGLHPYVPQPYHIVPGTVETPHWIFMEYIPCMSLGPLWQGREFAKALEGLAWIHARFWGKQDLLDHAEWLPVIHAELLIRAVGEQVESLHRATARQQTPPALIRAVITLCDRACRYPQQVERMAAGLAGQPFTLVHGDYHLANIGTRDMTDGATPVVADWSNCAVGPPQLDLVYLMNAVQGMQRDHPDRQSLRDHYLALLEAAGIRPAPDSFGNGLAAAAFFEDIRALARLFSNWESEASWRAGISWSIEAEAELRINRALSCFS